MNQLSFFNQPSTGKSSGAQLRDKGIKKAADHAEEVNEGWGKKALDFLYLYAMQHSHFSGEMVRIESKGIVPDPPHARAWGSVMVAGCKRGFIKQVGFVHVQNERAHMANAALWESLINKETL